LNVSELTKDQRLKTNDRGSSIKDKRQGVKDCFSLFRFHLLKIFCLWSLVFGLFFLTGCASLGTYNTATGRREFIIIPTSSEVVMGQDIHRDILKENELSNRQDQIERVRRVGQRLAQVSDRQDYQYRFFVIEKNEINAFTTPGGNVYIYSGLLDKLKTDDQIAAVLAHEIGHCAARHTIKKFQAAVSYDLIGNIILSQVETSDQIKRIASLSSGAVMSLVFSAYGRKDEYEADRLGVRYMYLADYDLQGMIETLQVLKQESKGEDVPLILRTHPYLNDRLEAVKKEIDNVKTRYE